MYKRNVLCTCYRKLRCNSTDDISRESIPEYLVVYTYQHFRDLLNPKLLYPGSETGNCFGLKKPGSSFITVHENLTIRDQMCPYKPHSHPPISPSVKLTAFQPSIVSYQFSRSNQWLTYLRCYVYSVAVFLFPAFPASFLFPLLNRFSSILFWTNFLFIWADVKLSKMPL